jgi:TrmH family RNA methyltransferase
MYREAARRRHTGDLLLDGDHLMAEADAAGLPIRHVAIAASRWENPQDAAGSLALRLEQRGKEVAAVPASVLAALSPVRTPSGIVALAARPSASLDRLLAAPAPLLLVAIDIQDPGNLGALVRAAEAAGATGLIASGESADPFGWKALRGAMGSAFRLPIVAGTDPLDLLPRLRAHRIRTLAMMPGGGTSLYEATLQGPLAVLLGSEGQGLAPALAAAADQAITIPMRAPVESLNVSVAGALLLFEAARQRGAASA